MILNRKSSDRKRGFTLVELMVAAALTITIMWIMSESFKMGIDFARSARSTGDMMTQLNNAGQVLSGDLQNDHFYVTQAGLSGDLGKLSSQRLDNLGGAAAGTPATTTGIYTNPGRIAIAGGYLPPQGYVQFYSPPPNAQSVPLVDHNPLLDDSGEFLINTVNGGGSITNPAVPWNGTVPTGTPYLRFTVNRPQGLPQNVFTATTTALGGGSLTYSSQAAEVAYFLGSPLTANGGGLGIPTGSTLPVAGTADQPAQPAMPLYNLYRRQRLVAQTSDFQPNLSPALSSETLATIQDIISFTPLPQPAPLPQFQVNTLASFGQPYTLPTQPAPIPANRMLLQPLTTQGRVGDDILLSNVLSFEVLACWTPPFSLLTGSPQFPIQLGLGSPIATPFSASTPNTNNPFDHLPPYSLNQFILPGTFDTWFAAIQPYPIGVPPNMTQFINWNWDNFYELNNPGPLFIPPAGPKGKPRHIPNLPNPNLIPMPLRITALQITIRIYDLKTKQARQNTWRVSM